MSSPQPTEAPEDLAYKLLQQGDNGANWFFWIAALSLVNTALTHFGAEIHFVIGLGATLIVDAVSTEIVKQNPETHVVATSIAVGFSLFCSAIACMFGWLSRKRYLIVFGIGAFIYLLDALPLVFLGDWMSVAFHAFALFQMVAGINAYRQYNQLAAQGLDFGDSVANEPEFDDSDNQNDDADEHDQRADKAPR
jgi:hypothetical protein